MRALLWLLLVASVLANVFIGTFADWADGPRIAGSLGTGAVLLGSAAGLWLTRPRAGA
ncbi:hypothetical protein [Streptomyces sp. NK15101]|uniref:hypothetical protein n=1 Tax=Streptomyces sp. NK15101 TaxID=2873261 RepID=UPI001CED920D|nr:hypothetical protein [Streptomyces sp. NK15101]